MRCNENKGIYIWLTDSRFIKTSNRFRLSNIYLSFYDLIFSEICVLPFPYLFVNKRLLPISCSWHVSVLLITFGTVVIGVVVTVIVVIDVVAGAVAPVFSILNINRKKKILMISLFLFSNDV